MIARILTIAGSDSGGGAGIQGDIKTITCLGGYAASAITALTAQNTLGVFGIHDVPEAFIAQQITLVLEDIGADAIKTGMLHKTGVIETIANVLDAYPDIPLIVDPVMVAKGGAALLEPQAIAAMTTLLFPKAMLITPNIPEAELLLGYKIEKVEVMKKAAEQLLQFGSGAVLLKGGHLEASEEVTDILATSQGLQLFTSPRIKSRHTHGTGCCLASAIATFTGQGFSLESAVEKAREYVLQAIMTAPFIGKGHGPLHFNLGISK